MEERLRIYAELLLKKGVNLQREQILVVNATTEVDYFVEILAEEAYKLGAKEVEVRFSNDKLTRLKYENAPLEVFEECPQFRVDSIMYYVEKGACVINILSQNPDNLVGIDDNKIAIFNKVSALAMTPYREIAMANKLRWLGAAVPGKAWAEKLFPDDENPVEKLWNVILKCARADGDEPANAWQEHLKNIENNYNKLNKMDFESLHFKASNGTDIIVGLCEDAIWCGGRAVAEDGIVFSPNIPTEEIYTASHREKINGTVVGSMPLNYNGTIIDQFSITFKNGRVCSYKAEIGQEALNSLLEIDDGAKSLGEVALVPFSSPIRQTGILFYNTLFDENAACHFAFGAGYPFTVDQTRNPNKSLVEKGLNVSKTHVDFMFGTADMECIGIKKDGTRVAVMRNGEIVLNEPNML